MTAHDDFHTEPIPGLPARPPEGESILWQGKPERSGLFVSALHGRKVAIYFALLMLWKLIAGISDGKLANELWFSVGGTALLALASLALLFLLAHLIVRTTIYTITTKRLVMRFGVALPITFQFPFSQIISADVKPLGRGRGNIAISLKEHTKVSWLILWPHVRAWKLARPQPTMRALGNVDDAAQLLAHQLRQSHQTSAAGPTISKHVEPSQPAPAKAPAIREIGTTAPATP